MRFRASLVSAVLAGAFAATAAHAAGQAGQAQTDPSAFFERVDVDVINVEAFVTDKKGNAVSDLDAADFEIFEDGQPVEISNFFRSERHSAAPAAELLPHADALAATGSSAVLAPRELPEDQRTNLLVYVDLFNLSSGGKLRVLQQLGGFLEERLRQGDRIMTVAHNRNIIQLHPFTQDVAEVRRGIDRMMGMATEGQINEAERQRVHRSVFVTNADTTYLDKLTAADNIRSYIQQRRMDTEMCMNALGRTLRSLGGLPGRRALLYISEGLEQQPGADLLQVYRELYGNNPREGINPGIERALSDQMRLFREVTNAANTYQVTLYTLQARGSGGIQALNASSGDQSVTYGGQWISSGAGELSAQEPLLAMADQTGGAAIINTANYSGALAELSKSFDSLYSLGYRSRGGGDGKYHKIEVKVKRPGLEVRHRKGYIDAPESERVADRAFSSLILDRESNPLEVQVVFAPPKPQGLDKYHVPVLVTIPLRQVSLLPVGDVQKGKLHLYFAVQDPDGAISQVQEIPYPVEIPAAEAAGLADKEIGYALKLAVREGHPKIAISVWDEVSGVESYLLRDLEVGGAEKVQKAAR